MRKISIKIKLIIGIMSVIFCMVLGISRISSSFESYSDASEWNTHTYNVILNLNGITSSLVDMETGQRGYAITGEQSFLDPFYDGEEQYKIYYETAVSLTSDNPEQQERLEQISELAGKYISALKTSMVLRNEGKTDKAALNKIAEYEKTETGKGYMDQIRTLVDKCKSVENERNIEWFD